MRKNCSIVKHTFAVAGKGMVPGALCLVLCVVGVLGAQAQIQIAPVWEPAKKVVPSVQLGVVAQRYPWNGILDVQYKTTLADASHTVTFYANGIKLGTARGTGGEMATVSFDLKVVADGVFKNKQLKDVKITATIE